MFAVDENKREHNSNDNGRQLPLVLVELKPIWIDDGDVPIVCNKDLNPRRNEHCDSDDVDHDDAGETRFEGQIRVNADAEVVDKKNAQGDAIKDRKGLLVYQT